MSLNTVAVAEGLVVWLLWNSNFHRGKEERNPRGSLDALSARTAHTHTHSRGKRSLLFTSDRETDVKRMAACNQRRITYPRYVEIARNPARRAVCADPSFIAKLDRGSRYNLASRNKHSREFAADELSNEPGDFLSRKILPRRSNLWRFRRFSWKGHS